MADRRLVLVHAHPDDESIETGATMAKYVAEGTRVCLVTCTLGEEGEVIPPELRHLAGARLGEYRIGELEAACAALGVTDHRFLGGAGRWRDSGMMGVEANEDPRCFWRADLDEAARALAGILREVRPQAIVTYDARGYYGHPDHIQAHRVAWRAFRLSGDPSYGSGEPWRVGKFYATAMPSSVLRSGVDAVRTGSGPFAAVASVDDLPFGVPDEQITTRIDGRVFLEQKLAALRAHRTQVMVDEPFFALSDNVGHRVEAVEYYTLLAGEPGEAGPDGLETDLFS